MKEKTITEVYLDPLEHDDYDSIPIDRMVDNYDPEEIRYLDLVSTYRIVNQRYSYTKEDQLYAKEYVQRQFKQICDNHEILTQKNPIYYFDLYLYLIAQTWVFNIDIPLICERITVKIDKDRQCWVISINWMKLKVLLLN